MRRLAFSVLWCLPWFAVAATAAEKIPQDPALAAKLSREWLEWNRRTLIGVYEKVGVKDPRWDAKVRETMEQAARMFSLQLDPEVKPADVFKPADEAVRAGCKDPLILYLQFRTDEKWFKAPPAESAKRMKEVAKNLGASKYPVFRRAIALQIAGTALSAADPKAPAGQKEAKEQFDATLALLPASVAGDEHSPYWQDRWDDTLNNLIAGYRQAGVDPVAAYEKVDAALAKQPALEALRYKVRGTFWFNYGWEARGKSFAGGVSQEGAAKFGERVAKAKTAFEKSWSLKPNADVATKMIEVDKSIGGDRKNMETWFERAMKLNPNHRSACWSKLDWLDPKWHGSSEEMIAFGRACFATGNWHNGITLLAGDAHYRLASRLAPEEKPKYLAAPEVWSEIGPAYDEYLKHEPDDVASKSKYAVLCYLADRYGEAHELFQQLGDDLTMWREFPYYPLEEMKRMRSEAAKWVNSQPKAEAKPKAETQPKASGAPVLP